MFIKKARSIILIVSGLFLLLDQFLKWQATHAWNNPALINKFLGWQVFLNKGLAFGLPLPNTVTITFTSLMIFLIIYLIIRERNIISFLAWSMVLAGAVSNFIDRITFGHVIDYILILTSVINLADAMIVVGLALYLINAKFQMSNDK